MTTLLKNPLKNESPVDQTVDADRRRRAPQLAGFSSLSVNERFMRAPFGRGSVEARHSEPRP
jgi:hypothetical protein